MGNTNFLFRNNFPFPLNVSKNSSVLEGKAFFTKATWLLALAVPTFSNPKEEQIAIVLKKYETALSKHTGFLENEGFVYKL